MEWTQPGFCGWRSVSDEARGDLRDSRKEWDYYKAFRAHTVAAGFYFFTHTLSKKLQKRSRKRWGERAKPWSVISFTANTHLQWEFDTNLSFESLIRVCKDREDTRQENWVLKNRFQHESTAVSHHISSDINWKGRAFQYSTQKPAGSEMCAKRPLRTWQNSPPTSRISRLCSLTCHADIKGNFLLSLSETISLIFSHKAEWVTPGPPF